MFRAVARIVAVAALPVQEPEEPDALPVTLPVNPPTNPPLAVTIPAAAILPLVNTVAPVLTDNAAPSYVNVDSPSNVLAVPEPVINLLFALLFIVVPVIPVKFDKLQ